MTTLKLETLITATQLQQRIEQLGQAITRVYQGSRLCIIGVLKGSFVFLADLIRQINLGCDIEFLAAASYEGMQSSGQLEIHYDRAQNIKGRHVLLVEDIIDTGLTVDGLLKLLQGRSPLSLKVCTLLAKPEAHEVSLHLDYVGFNISREFVVGYGLDYDGLYRNLGEVMQVKSK